MCRVTPQAFPNKGLHEVKLRWAQFQWYPWPSALHNIKVKNLKFYPMIPGEYPLGIMRKTFRQGNSIFQNAPISCFPCDTQWVPLGITWKNSILTLCKALSRGYYWNWCQHSFSKMPHGFLHFFKHFSKYATNVVGTFYGSANDFRFQESLGKCSSVLVCQRIP